MELESVDKLQFSRSSRNESHPLPMALKDCLQLISNFFSAKNNNKLCLVFPAKDHIAQWLTTPAILHQIKSDFGIFNSEIAEAYKHFKPGAKLLLNNEVVVEWVRVGEIEKKGKPIKVAFFKTKPSGESSGLTISIPFKQIIKLQTTDRKVLSPSNRVMSVLPKRNISPLENLLNIETYGNTDFIKNSICLISTLKSYGDSITDVHLNGVLVDDYFKVARINDSGDADIKSPLLISNNLRNLALYVTVSEVSKIIIDGYSAVRERAIDFNDIDAKQIPTILITDLSEVENFDRITDFGFDFFNFTKEHLIDGVAKQNTPFSSFNGKIERYRSFRLVKEICQFEEIEQLFTSIHLIGKDDSVKEFTNLKVLVIQLANLVSRIAQPVSAGQVNQFQSSLSRIEEYYKDHRHYLGDSLESFDTSIKLLKSIIEKTITSPTPKWIKLNELLAERNYDYIICGNDDEVVSLTEYLNKHKPHNNLKIISVSDIKINFIQGKTSKAILTGWVKSSNISFLLSCFLFNELTVLFYDFEGKYLDSLQRRNQRLSSNVNSTINKDGLRVKVEHDFSNHYTPFVSVSNGTSENYDVAEFEARFDNSLFSKYIVKTNQIDSVRARRVEFKNDKFIYLTDSHSLLVLDNYNSFARKSLHIHKSRVEGLHTGDIIAFIKTERELLNKIVEQQTTPVALNETTKWINLWKRLLKDHYKLLNGDFNRLVGELKERGCTRDQVTIRSWLFDDLRIGPRKDEDLIAIAIMTNGTELYNNIHLVRNAIRQMTGWRMKASDYVIEQLKSKIKSTNDIKVNSVVDFENLGDVEILEISEIKNAHDNIDIRYANRLLDKIKL